MIRFILNEKTIATDLPAGMVLLDFIRYHQHLTGTKVGCREGDCGACTVLVGELNNDELSYHSVTSCLMPIGNAAGKHIVTIEGINRPDALSPVQQAMADCGATQCGFCTPGFIVSLTGFCLSHQSPTTENAIAAIDGNICRCTGYKSIEKAAALIATQLSDKKEPLDFVTTHHIVPDYFSGIKERLQFIGGQLQSAALKDMAAQQERPHFVGGGTDLYVQKQEEMKEAAIRFLLDHPSMNSIEQEGDRCVMGPSVTVSDLMASPVINEAFPAFHRYAKLVSSTPIRNMATIAGNIINASPIGDFTIFFLALDAQLTLSDGTHTRQLPVRQLYTGYKTLAKKPAEHIAQISFSLPGKNHLFHFEKVSKRTHLDIASVNTACCLHLDGDTIVTAGLSAGGVGPIPLYLAGTSAFLTGKKINAAVIDDAIAVMKTEIAPISDARGTKEYKTLLLGQLLKAHFIELGLM